MERKKRWNYSSSYILAPRTVWKQNLSSGFFLKTSFLLLIPDLPLRGCLCEICVRVYPISRAEFYCVFPWEESAFFLALSRTTLNSFCGTHFYCIVCKIKVYQLNFEIRTDKQLEMLQTLRFLFVTADFFSALPGGSALPTAFIWGIFCRTRQDLVLSKARCRF